MNLSGIWECWGRRGNGWQVELDLREGERRGLVAVALWNGSKR